MHFHIKLRYKGASEAVKKWHNFMQWVDRDWPYINPQRAICTKTRVCKNCGGRCYIGPKFAPEDVKRAAKMFGVKVKIDRFAPVGKCFPNGLAESYGHVLESELSDG